MTGDAVTGTRFDASVPSGAAGSGPAVARLFHRLLAAIFVIAWLSLYAQVDVLIGSRGLLPLAPFLAANRAVSLAQLPTLFWLDASDGALHAGIWIGLALSVAALLGWWPRACIGAATVLYLSYASAARSFLSFQWDNLLLECGALAVFLPTERPARWIHVLFRLLLFKLYWESGIAKWQSFIGDWQDGSAMEWYYQTAPLPTWLAWYAHHLPVAWHHVESWAVLVLELVLPFGIFGPRRVRLALFIAFGAFQLVNLATANYGFFVYLALALSAFLLDDRDVSRVAGLLPRWRRRRPPPLTPPNWRRTVGLAGAAVVSAVYVGVSLADAAAAFTQVPPPWAQMIEGVRGFTVPWRLVNTYHLFGQITRERIESEFQVEVEGEWHALQLHHKPGDPQRAPDFVAPHQPRVDFQLWFYGLNFQHGSPAYVAALLERLCDDPAAVAPLFTDVLPAHPAAVRIAFWDYRFTDVPARRDTGAWWTRRQVATTRAVPCDGQPAE